MKMKCVLVLLLLGLVTLSSADTETYPRGCIYILGRCKEPCPVGTRAYTTGCGQKLPEATCEEPNPVPEEGILCDYSACYCEPGTVRDTKTKSCVTLDKCTKPEEKNPHNMEEPSKTEK